MIKVSRLALALVLAITTILSRNVKAPDLDSFPIIATIPVDNPSFIAMDSINNRIYVTSENSKSLTVVDGSDYENVHTIPLDYFPKEIDVNPITNKIYVSLDPNDGLTPKFLGVFRINANFSLSLVKYTSLLKKVSGVREWDNRRQTVSGSGQVQDTGR